MTTTDTLDTQGTADQIERLVDVGCGDCAGHCAFAA